MMDLEVQRFLDGYRNAFERGAVPEIVDHYDVPTSSISGKEVAVFQRREELLDVFTAVTNRFRELGLARCEFQLRELRLHENGLAELGLGWRLLGRDDSLIKAISLRYLLRRSSEGFKIGTIMLFDE